MQVTVGGVDYLIPAYALLSGNPGTWAAYVNNIGPYAWWRMDEAVGATALTDQVGASTATLAGSYTLHSPGLLNDGDTDTAVLFTNGSAISAANAKWAIGTGDVSILCIAKFTGTTFQSIASIRDGSGTNIMGLFGINSSVG